MYPRACITQTSGTHASTSWGLTCESVPRRHYVSVDGESPLSGRGGSGVSAGAVPATIGQRGQDAAS